MNMHMKRALLKLRLFLSLNLSLSLSFSCCLIEPKLFVESCANDRKTNASMPVMQNWINGVLSLLDSNTRNWPNKGPQIYVLIDEVEIPDSPCSVLFMCVYVCVCLYVENMQIVYMKIPLCLPSQKEAVNRCGGAAHRG